MNSIINAKFPVKPTRRAPRPAAPFAAGLLSGLSDDEQLILDELSGEWPPADADLDAESDPAEWADWTDAYRFEPSPDEEAWAAHEMNRAAADFEVIAPHPADVLGRSMMGLALARALACDPIPLD